MFINKLKDISLIINEERSRQKLTQAQAAALCHVGTRFISDLENGKETVHFGKVMQVLEGLGLEMTVLEKCKKFKISL